MTSDRPSPGGSAPETCVSALLGIGSNLGDREGNITRALELLRGRAGIKILRLSKLVETEPVGGPPQGRYLNGVLEIETTLDPRSLLHTCEEVEAAIGRVRTVRNAPRTMDLDILLYSDWIISEPGLEIPHARMLERMFVLEPLTEVAPHRVHPVTKKSCFEHWTALREKIDPGG